MLCLGMCLAARFGSAAIAQFGGRQTEDLTLPGLVPGLGGFLLPSTRWSLHSCLGLRKDGRDDLELFSSQANQWLSSSLKKCPTIPPHISQCTFVPHAALKENKPLSAGVPGMPGAVFCYVLGCEVRQSRDSSVGGLGPGSGQFSFAATRWSPHSSLGLRKNGRDDLELFLSSRPPAFFT